MLQWERREGKNTEILTPLYSLLDIALKLHRLAIWICCILKSIISAVHSAYSRCAQKANTRDLRILSASTLRQIVRCVQLCLDQMWHGSVGYSDIHMPGFQGRRQVWFGWFKSIIQDKFGKKEKIDSFRLPVDIVCTNMRKIHVKYKESMFYNCALNVKRKKRLMQ